MKTKTTPIRIHPNLLHNLQKVYIAKSKVSKKINTYIRQFY